MHSNEAAPVQWAPGALATKDRLLFAELSTTVFVEGAYAPNQRIPEHAHRYAHCTYVVAGGYWESSVAHQRFYSAGDLLFHHSAQIHANVIGDRGARCLNVEFLYGEPLVPAMCAMRSETPVFSVNADLVEVAGHLSAGNHSPVGAERDWAWIRSAILRVLWQALLVDAPPWLERCLHYLNNNVTEPPALTELSQVAGVHPTHLLRVFRNKLGQTPRDYVQARRVATACDLLLRTDRPLAEIALVCGFYDQAHFTRVFRRFVGATPRVFRVARKLGER